MLKDCSNGLVCSHLASIFFGNLLPHKLSVYPSDLLWLVGQWQMWQKKRLKSAYTLGRALLLLLKLYNYHKTNKKTWKQTNKKTQANFVEDERPWEERLCLSQLTHQLNRDSWWSPAKTSGIHPKLLTFRFMS